ncbi:MAG: hypothetical protein ABWY34_06160, partial [Pseudoxanthomonas sp.]
IVPGAQPYAVLEDFTRHDGGRLLFVDAQGIRLDLPKTAESTEDPTPGLYAGRTEAQIKAGAADLLGNEILAGNEDPQYDQVARVFPPLRNVRLGTYDFIGTPDNQDKVNFNYGGRSPNFDPAVLQPSILDIRKAGKVWNGLVGGYLPALRFVYPEAGGGWTEMVAYAPFRTDQGNDRIQPVWYRVSRIEQGTVKWSRYVDTYLDFPPRDSEDPQRIHRFYGELALFKGEWDRQLQQAMQVELPDARMQDMARFGLVRAMLTRMGDFPKYGAIDKDYGGSEHDGFPDTFNVETTAMLDWGLLDRAGRYIDNYFTHFVRDDGSLLYRGPETGQYGRMLTVVARYAQVGGDPRLLLKHRRRIDAIARLLLSLRRKALTLPKDDAAHGMIAGWSEADAVLERDPARYMLPYFSNSTEAVRGFAELGGLWRRLGREQHDKSLQAWGAQLVDESAALKRDLDTSIARSLLHAEGETILPSVAGAKEPFHVAVPRDPLDPQYRAYRANMEMAFSGVLTPQQVALVLDYRARHHDVLLGMPTAYGYNTGEMAGFLAYGHGYGLIQLDRIREALLLLYSDMAHQYTRGSWLAPETRGPMSSREAAPYCTPAQLVASLMTRWLLVFEDPRSETLWLGKGLPREWLRDGETVAVAAAPTRWGRVGYRIESQLASGKVAATIDLPSTGLGADIKLRLRAPAGQRLHAVSVGGQPWERFEAAAETIDLPRGARGRLSVLASYRPAL